MEIFSVIVIIIACIAFGFLLAILFYRERHKTVVRMELTIREQDRNISALNEIRDQLEEDRGILLREVALLEQEASVLRGEKLANWGLSDGI